MTSRIASITFDCSDRERLAQFWAAALGYVAQDPSGEFLELAPPSREGPWLLFQNVPEAKRAKNRLHLDLKADDEEAELKRLVELGATKLEVVEGQKNRWTVMADPEGNEFCL